MKESLNFLFDEQNPTVQNVSTRKKSAQVYSNLDFAAPLHFWTKQVIISPSFNLWKSYYRGHPHEWLALEDKQTD